MKKAYFMLTKQGKLINVLFTNLYRSGLFTNGGSLLALLPSTLVVTFKKIFRRAFCNGINQPRYAAIARGAGRFELDKTK